MPGDRWGYPNPARPVSMAITDEPILLETHLHTEQRKYPKHSQLPPPVVRCYRPKLVMRGIGLQNKMRRIRLCLKPSSYSIPGHPDTGIYGLQFLESITPQDALTRATLMKLAPSPGKPLKMREIEQLYTVSGHAHKRYTSHSRKSFLSPRGN